MTKGERIKNLREMRGLSQVSLADRIGVSKQTLYKYENNIVTNIPSDKIEAIAEVTGSTPSYLMGWDEETAAVRVYKDEFSNLTAEERQLVEHFRAADEPIRVSVRKLLDMPEEEKSASLGLSVG